MDSIEFLEEEVGKVIPTFSDQQGMTPADISHLVAAEFAKKLGLVPATDKLN